MTPPQIARESGLPEHLIRNCMEPEAPDHLISIEVTHLSGKVSRYVKRTDFERWLKERER